MPPKKRQRWTSTKPGSTQKRNLTGPKQLPAPTTSSTPILEGGSHGPLPTLDGSDEQSISGSPTFVSLSSTLESPTDESSPPMLEDTVGVPLPSLFESTADTKAISDLVESTGPYSSGSQKHAPGSFTSEPVQRDVATPEVPFQNTMSPEGHMEGKKLTRPTSQLNLSSPNESLVLSDDSARYSVGSNVNISLSSMQDALLNLQTPPADLHVRLKYEQEDAVYAAPETEGKDELAITPTNLLDGLDSNLASTSADMDAVEPDLLEVACQKIASFLHSSWMAKVQHGGINVMMLSRQKQMAIQRTLFFSPDGKVSLSVHCQPMTLPANFWGDLNSPGPLNKSSIDSFVDRCVKFVNHLRRFEICAGFDHEEYREVWPTMTTAEVDKNPYQESKYSQTLRSNKCTRLVSGRQWRCKECNSLKRSVERRWEMHTREDPCPKTANIHLSEEQKLRKLEEQSKKIKAYVRKMDRMEEKMQKLLITDSVRVDDDLSEDLTNILKNSDLKPVHEFFLHQQVKASKAKGRSGVRWHPDMIRFALALYMDSPSAYATARDSGMIKLPSQRTLYDYTHVYKAEEGLDEHVLQDVSERIQKMPHKYQKYFVLSCDEMHICRNLVFKRSTGELLGYAKLSEAGADVAALHAFLESGKTEVKPELASKMLCFMIKGVANNVKEVVASFSVNRLSTEFLFECTWEVINKCERAGVAIVAFVADGFAVNRSFMKMHVPTGVTESGLVYATVNFAAPDRNLYLMSDVAHLLKTVRNCLYNSGTTPKSTRLMEKNGEKMVWQTIIDLYKSANKDTLRKAYKLTQENVVINSYSAMKVKHAAAVLSKTVAKEIEDKNWPQTKELVNFIRLVNDWFDCLNGAHSDHGKRTRNKNLEPYTSPEDTRFDFLQSFLKYLSDWKEEAEAVEAMLNMTPSFLVQPEGVDDPVLDFPEHQGEEGGNEEEPQTPAAKKLLSSQTMEGIEFTTMAFIDCVKFLLREGVQFVNPRVFSQDHIEQHFSKQRSRGGGSSNPNYGRFLQNNVNIHIQREVGVRKRKANTESLSQGMKLCNQPLPKRKKNS